MPVCRSSALHGASPLGKHTHRTQPAAQSQGVPPPLSWLRVPLVLVLTTVGGEGVYRTYLPSGARRHHHPKYSNSRESITSGLTNNLLTLCLVFFFGRILASFSKRHSPSPKQINEHGRPNLATCSGHNSTLYRQPVQFASHLMHGEEKAERFGPHYHV